ncbi:MAG: ATP-binding protein [Marinobacterium sp.]|nr:ATP-binding protein [Marinobacterium sp.]
MTITRLAVPALALSWSALIALILYGWLHPQGLSSVHWLESWYQLALALAIIAALLTVLVIYLQRRSLRAIANAMPEMVTYGIGYQIRNARRYGEEAVLFNRLSKRLASTLSGLNSERHLLRETLDCVDGVILMVDGQGRIELVTPYVEQMFGWQRKQLQNHAVSVLLPEYAELTASMARHEDTAFPRSGIEQQTIACCEDGQISGAVVLFQRREENSGYVLLVRDVTCELETRREAQLLRDALDSSNEGVMLFDSGDQLIWANRRASELLGLASLSNEQNYSTIMTGAVSLGMLPEASHDPESWLASARDLHDQAEQYRDMQCGDGRWLREKAMKTRHGGVLTLLTDITADRQTGEQLVAERDQATASRDEKGRFLTVMSHEIRTPLNGMLGMLELMSSETDVDKRAHYTHTALEAGNNLNELINNLLDLARLDAGRLRLRPKPCLLPDLLTSVVDLMQPLANRKGLQLQIEQDSLPDTPLILDSGRLRQVLLNLLGNAIKFTDQGEVRLVCRADDKRLRFEVIDTGPGISEACQQALFQAFSMLDENYSRNQSGAGLGLAISQRLVERMGGEIRINSVPGQGSCFWFRLVRVDQNETTAPDLSDDVAEQTAQDREPAGLEQQACQVLLVEDNDTNRQVVEQMLLRAGHQVDTVNNGADAISALQLADYQVVLMDISMPVMDGMEATRRIRQLNGAVAHLPIIALTAHSQMEERQAFMEAGMDDYLHKPVHSEALLAMISRWQYQQHDKPMVESVASANLQPVEHMPINTRPVNTRPVNTQPTEQGSNTEPLAVSAQTAPLLDETVLQRMAQDLDKSVMPRLIHSFISTTRERQQFLIEAITGQDHEQLQREVHNLKSSAATYGLVRVQQLAAEVEQLCKQGQYNALPEPARQLMSELEPALSELEALDCNQI